MRKNQRPVSNEVLAMRITGARRAVNKCDNAEAREVRISVELDASEEKRLADSLEVLTGLGKTLLREEPTVTRKVTNRRKPSH